jgi:hypothetical protein
MFGHVILGIRRTAIDAAKIAAIGDGDAQIGDLAPEFVEERHYSV